MMNSILGLIWKNTFLELKTSQDTIKRELRNCPDECLSKELEMLQKEGYILGSSKNLRISHKGREKIKVVVCGGVFDILHPGHAFILEEAKKLGDVLVVIVARDSTVENRKRIPIVPETQRAEMVSALKHVDISLVGYAGDPLKIIEEIKPDIIALGPDQHHDKDKLLKRTMDRGLKIGVVRIREFKNCELNSTKMILQRIIERNYPDERTENG